ncbi:MAG: DNA-directed RNA polymerase subunit H [Nitrososphaeria archaeon]|nr:DNA-directed RNA polymerase subunit H [Nitrososphaeria archaeon]
MDKKTPQKEFSIMNHILVPKHEVLSSEEAKNILETYRVKPHQLPYILSSDPVVKELGAKPGDIIKITRKSDVSGIAYYYRYVIEG